MNPMNDEFNWTPDELQAIVDEHALVLFMKGEPGAPQCGFSNRAAQALQAFGEPFASVNILTDRRAIPAVCEWSDFPTMPQIFVHGELIGGSDIVLEMLQDGSLREMFDEGRQAKASYPTHDQPRDCESSMRANKAPLSTPSPPTSWL